MIYLYLYAKYRVTMPVNTLIEMPLRDATPESVKDWQEKFPDATLRIEGAALAGAAVMDEPTFWRIIGLLDWRTRDEDNILAPAVEALSRFDESAIHRFHDILNEKLHALDGRRFAEQLGSNRYAPGKRFSVDGFLYARCCVVANGQAFYESVLADPARMPKEFTFETLLYLPAKAWERKTGSAMERRCMQRLYYYPAVWAETFSNPERWPGVTPVQERLKQAE